MNWSSFAHKVMLGCLILGLFVLVIQLSTLGSMDEYKWSNKTSSETSVLFMVYGVFTSVMSIYALGPPYSTLASTFIGALLVGVVSVRHPRLAVELERIALTIVNLFLIAEYFIIGWLYGNDILHR